MKLPFRLTPAHAVLLGFAGIILLGTLLLMLPFASPGPGGASFLTALFTATSSTCVTGLAAVDTIRLQDGKSAFPADFSCKSPWARPNWGASSECFALFCAPC